MRHKYKYIPCPHIFFQSKSKLFFVVLTNS